MRIGASWFAAGLFLVAGCDNRAVQRDAALPRVDGGGAREDASLDSSVDAPRPDAGQLDAGPLDGGPPDGLGDPCERNADCPSGVCLPTGRGNVCTEPCATESTCPPGWTCEPRGGVETPVCACTAGDERCNGLDDDCDGIADDGSWAELGCAANEECWGSGGCVCPAARSCGAGCADLDNDVRHCGRCGNACATGGSCDTGACICPGVRGTDCDGTCRDLDNDLAHCGACNYACPVGASCTGGTCSCPSGTMECDGACRDLSADRDNCGVCGRACGFACVSSACDDVVQLAVGGGHSCARLASGRVLCWGANGSGQLGNGSITSAPNPTPALVTGIAAAEEITAGLAFTCARQAGQVYCWGDNFYGQLGDGTNDERAVPALVSGLSGVVQISAGSSFACALRSDGTTRCWGSNVSGQLGNGSTTDRSTPQSVSTTMVFTQISSGALHACGLLSNGYVSCWGRNGSGELGNPLTVANETRPSALVTNLTDAVAISAGASTTCARRSGGTLVCWGSNEYGQLGGGSTGGFSRTPISVRNLTGVTQMSADGHVCAVHSGGTSCWGRNFFGQLADGTTNNRSTPYLISGLSAAAVHTNGGSSFTCAQRTDGAIACWGTNSIGQLGDGTTTDRPFPTLVQP